MTVSAASGKAQYTYIDDAENNHRFSNNISFPRELERNVKKRKSCVFKNNGFCEGSILRLCDAELKAD